MDIISIIIILLLSYWWWLVDGADLSILGIFIFGAIMLGAMILITPIFSSWFDSFFIHLFGFIPLITPLCVFIASAACMAVITIVVYLIILATIMIFDIDETIYNYKKEK